MSRKAGSLSVGIRWRDDAWELRCPDCAVAGRTACYWPLTAEFWNPVWGMTRCRACWRQRKASSARLRRTAKERRDRDAANCRAQRARQKIAALSEIRRAVAA